MSESPAISDAIGAGSEQAHGDEDAPRDLDGWLARMRALVRRHILLNAAWLPGIQDGPSGRALVAFIMDEAGVGAENAADVAELDEEFGRVDGHLPTNGCVAERFEVLRRRLPLSPLECDAIWALLAPEFDSRFLAIYRMIWGDPSQRYCDTDFLFTLLSPHGPFRLTGLLDDSSAPVRLDLISTFSERRSGPRFYRPSRRVIDFLTGVDALPPGLANAVHLEPPIGPPAWRGLDLAGPLQELLSAAGPNRRVFIVEAPRRASVDMGVRQVAGSLRQPVARFDLAGLAGLAGPTPGDEASGGIESAPTGSPLMRDNARLLRALLREARLTDAILHIRGGETLDDLPDEHARLLAELIGYDTQTLVIECAGAAPAGLLVHLMRTTQVTVTRVEAASGPQRRRMWAHLLGKRAQPLSDAQLDALASVPCDARSMEETYAIHRQTGRPLLDVARTLVARSLPRMARRVEVKLGWNDVVMTPDVRAQLEQIRTLSQHYERVMDTWALGRKTTGRGIKVLFSGPSGTGKTLTAGLLARDAQCELYQVDVASVLSKWVGETEKHLAQLFRDAASSGGALLFDEADALFRQRSSGDSSGGERFGSQLVNFLLEAIESFDGMIILTTNFESAIDTAFARRLNYHVRFQAPDAEQRTELWRLHLPAELPVSPAVVLADLGATYELTGGEIYKTAIRAAVHTLQRGGDQVEWTDIEEAIVSIYVEKGRLPPARSGPPKR
ncbi:MAG: ATP-binding protein [Myxococcota bacterium]